MSQSPQIKFRPSLTLDEISTIIKHLPPAYTTIHAKLGTFILKAQHGITRPSHVAIPSPSLADSLGFTSQSTQTTQDLLALYDNPATRNILSPSQLTQVQHHRYTHDLMTPQEEQDYESQS